MSSSRVLDVHLLGGFSVLLGSEPLAPMPSRHARLLFAYLALQPGRDHPRATLVGHLWPELDEPRARKRLSHTLWQVQDVLAEAAPGRSFLEATSETVRFGDEHARIDVHEFERGLDEVEARSDDPDGETQALLRHCVDLYRGDLLAGYYEGWILDDQARLSERYVSALTRLVTSAKRRSNFDEALTYARRLTHQAPLREDIHREVMRLCVLLGRHSEALHQYERCRTVLMDELGEEPDALTTELAGRIHRTRQARPPQSGQDRSIASRRLVGRRAERTRILARLDRALAGRGDTVLVEGEPGIGKTTLLSQVLDDARWRGMTVLWGGCHPEHDRPYHVLRQAIEPHLTPVRVVQLRHALGEEWLDDLSDLFPQVLPAPRRRSQLGAHASSDRMRESVVRLILALAQMAPTTLVIDDLQWCDAETLAVLGALARRHEDRPLLLLLGFRDQEARAATEVWATLRTLDRLGAPERIELTALTAFETAELVADAVVASHVPAAFAAAVQRESGGNPLYVIELLRTLRDRGVIDTQAELGDLDVPETSDLHALIAGRVAEIDGDAATVLRVAAILGSEFSVTVLADAAPVAPEALAVAIEVLMRRNLIETRADRAAFSHAAARQVVLRGIEDDERALLHGRAADALAASGEDHPDEVAHHLLAGGEPARALPYLRRAGAAAVALSAYRSAERYLAQAVALLERVPLGVEVRFDILGEHEVVLGVLGVRDLQGDRLTEMRRLAVADDHRHAEVLRRTALYQGLVDEYADGEHTAREAVALGARLGGVEHGAGLLVLGRVLSWSGRNNEAREVLETAAAALHDEPLQEAEARFALGTACTFVQDAPAALAALRRARELFETAGDRRGVAQVAGALAGVHALVGQLDAARREHEAAIAEASEIGFLFRVAISRLNLGNLLTDLRDPAAALRVYEEALEGFEALDNQRGIATVRINQAWVLHRWVGDDDTAEGLLDRALSFLLGVGNHAAAAHASETLGAIQRRRGDHVGARRTLDRALQWSRESDDRVGEVQALRGLTELALAEGDATQAVEHATLGRTRAEEADASTLVPELVGLTAVARLAAGDLDGAWEAATAAMGHLDATIEPHRLHHRIATVARATGREALAREHALRAATALEDALADLPDDLRRRSVREVPEHADIAAAATVHSARDVRLARIEAPRGRALRDDDTTPVRLQLPAASDTPDARRRALLSILDQAHAQGASATLDDLVDIVGVSRATVRRDLRWLRDAGHDVATRGSSAG